MSAFLNVLQLRVVRPPTFLKSKAPPVFDRVHGPRLGILALLEVVRSP